MGGRLSLYILHVNVFVYMLYHRKKYIINIGSDFDSNIPKPCLMPEVCGIACLPSQCSACSA